MASTVVVAAAVAAVIVRRSRAQNKRGKSLSRHVSFKDTVEPLAGATPTVVTSSAASSAVSSLSSSPVAASGPAHLSPISMSDSSGGHGSRTVALSQRWKRAVKDLLDDFVSSASVADGVLAVNELVEQLSLHLQSLYDVDDNEVHSAVVSEVVKQVVSAGMDRGEKQQELLARFLSALELFGTFNSADVAAGLTAVLQRLDDVIVDVPKADFLVANLVCQLILDGTIPESFLHVSGVADSDFVVSPTTATTRVAAKDGLSIMDAALVMAGRLTYSKVPHAVIQMKRTIRTLVTDVLSSGAASPSAVGLMAVVALVDSWHVTVAHLHVFVPCVDNQASRVRWTPWLFRCTHPITVPRSCGA